MTIRQYAQEKKIDLLEYSVESVNGDRLPGFVYNNDSEYRRKFLSTYGNMEIKDIYTDEYGNKIFEV